MSYNRFLFLLSTIRFDDKRTRNQRKETDKLAAIRFILDAFIKKCKSTYCLEWFCTIDEMLVPLEGVTVLSNTFQVNRPVGYRNICSM